MDSYLNPVHGGDAFRNKTTRNIINLIIIYVMSVNIDWI